MKTQEYFGLWNSFVKVKGHVEKRRDGKISYFKNNRAHEGAEHQPAMNGVGGKNMTTFLGVSP